MSKSQITLNRRFLLSTLLPLDQMGRNFVKLGDGKLSTVKRKAVLTLILTCTLLASGWTQDDIGQPNAPTVSVDGDPVGAAQCSDTIDNDSDGQIDYPADAGCTSELDNDESSDQGPPSPDLTFVQTTGTAIGATVNASEGSFFDAFMEDFTGDGWPDLVLADHARTDHVYFINNGSGSFPTRSQLPVNVPGFGDNWGGSFGYYWIDFDQDMDLDIILDDADGLASVVFRNNGSGGFTEFPVCSRNGFGGDRCRAFGDFNGDGQLDVQLQGGELVNLSTIIAPYTPAPFQTISGSHFRSGLDYTGDTWMDLLGHAGGSSRYFNSGAGVLVSQSAPPWGYSNEWAIADFDLDGDQDIFVIQGASFSPGTRSMFTNNGSGTFTSVSTTLSSGFGSSSGFYNYGNILAVDLDNDGDRDIVNGNYGPYEVWRNDGGFTFDEQTWRAQGSHSGSPGKTRISAADYDGDGLLDLYMTMSDGGLAHELWRNTTSNSNGWVSFQVFVPGTCISIYDAGTTNLVSNGCRVVDKMHQPNQMHFGLSDKTELDIVVQFPNGRQACTFYMFNDINARYVLNEDCTIDDMSGNSIAASYLPPFDAVSSLKDSFVTTQFGWYDLTSTTDKSGDINYYLYNRAKSTWSKGFQLNDVAMETEGVESAIWYVEGGFWQWGSGYEGGWNQPDKTAGCCAGDSKYTYLWPVRFLLESGRRTKDELLASTGYLTAYPSGTWDQMLEIWRDYMSNGCGWSAQNKGLFTNGVWNARFAGFCLENIVHLCEMGHAASCTDLTDYIDNHYDHAQQIAFPSDTYRGTFIHSWAANEGDAGNIGGPSDHRGFSPWMSSGILIPALWEAWLSTHNAKIETIITEHGWAMEQWGYFPDSWAGTNYKRPGNNSGVDVWYFAVPDTTTTDSESLHNYYTDLHLPEAQFATAAAHFFEQRKASPISARVTAFQNRLDTINGTVDGDTFYSAQMAAVSITIRVYAWQHHGTVSMEWLENN